MEKVEAKELTVRQIKELLDGMEKGANAEIADLLFEGEIPIQAVSLSTGIPVEELQGDITPSRLKEIIQEVREANPFFAGMMARLAKIGEEVLKKERSKGPSAA